MSEAIKGKDGEVRKAQMVVWRESKKKVFLRPLKELILLKPVRAEAIQLTVIWKNVPETRVQIP